MAEKYIEGKTGLLGTKLKYSNYLWPCYLSVNALRLVEPEPLQDRLIVLKGLIEQGGNEDDIRDYITEFDVLKQFEAQVAIARGDRLR